jgi:hypothetical protein
MDSTQIFLVQIVGNVVAFALIARWYVAPRLNRFPLAEALTPLLLLHLTRVVGLTILVPGIVDPSLPRSFATPAAYGDLLAAALALVSIGALRTGSRGAPIVVWIFSAEGIIDLVNAFVQGSLVDLPLRPIGTAWFIFTALVPALLVSHVMIVARLAQHARQGNGVRSRHPQAGVPLRGDRRHPDATDHG